MSLSDIFVNLECEQKFDFYFPKPSYHPKNKDVVILSPSDLEGSKKGIYEYNLQKNAFNKIYTYEPTFHTSSHGQFLDAKNELLYIFGYNKLGIFDLNTKVMNTNTKYLLRDCKLPRSTYIP
eukprot:1152_1